MLEKNAEGTNRTEWQCLANVLRQIEMSERTAVENAVRLASTAPLSHLVEGRCVEFKEYDFSRSPVVRTKTSSWTLNVPHGRLYGN